MINQIYKFLNPRFQKLFLEYKVDLKPRYGHGKPAHTELYNIINARRSNYIDILTRALNFKDSIWAINDFSVEKDITKPTWNNGFLPGLDIIGIYTLMAEYKPKKYIEIGSGNSTKVAFKAKTEQKLNTQIISIDPRPRAAIDHLADIVIREPFENTDYKLVDELNENDILFVDNSHRILPNSDSMVFYLEILPRLRKGVIVHIHDIYLPYDYPQFMCDRFYSEQYGLAMYLLANPNKYVTILPNYFIHKDKELSEHISPIWNHVNMTNVERHGGSLWLRINE
jgi:hypothetical protein